MLNYKGNYKKSLEIAKEASRSEKMLTRQREQLSSEQQPNLDLQYSVYLNLAIQQENNEMYADSLQTYTGIVRNKAFPNTGLLNLTQFSIAFIYFYLPSERSFECQYRKCLHETAKLSKSP